MDSKLPGFYKLSIEERKSLVAERAGLNEEEARCLGGEQVLGAEGANRMVENALGVYELPLGVCVNMVINGRDRLIPMVIEEPSVVAAASHAAKMIRKGGGIEASVSSSEMIGQIQLLDIPDADAAEATILENADQLLATANACDPKLLAVGGGARGIEVRHLPPMNDNDPLGPMLVVHLIVDVRDAMGANAINTMCERLAPELAALTGGRPRLRILSNLADRRTVTVTARVPVSELKPRTGPDCLSVARGIEEASVFAERDPYRAATHNKGIMNGIDAVLLAFGQDWRAVEAGAHAYAARNGRYTAMATWRLRGDFLEGRLEVPMAVGIVGGIVRVHPTVRAAVRVAGIESAADLAVLIASVGLAQNLGALRALSDEGIQSGHMRLHAKNVAAEAGVDSEDVDAVAEAIAKGGMVDAKAALEASEKLHGHRSLPPSGVSARP